jgi:hypothetical protein
MSFENYLVPVSIDGGYRYDLRKTGKGVGIISLENGMWVAIPYLPDGEPDLTNVKTFKRLGGAEYYLLALVFDSDNFF